jgi:hypothetical protein
METIDNINDLLGDDFKQTVGSGAKLRIAASCFSIYAYEALKKEWNEVDEVEFVFTSPTFVHGETTDRLPKERREFFIPKLERERSLYGTEFEIQLRNKLSQRGIARESAEWIRSKVTFRSNATKSPPRLRERRSHTVLHSSDPAKPTPTSGLSERDSPQTFPR